MTQGTTRALRRRVLAAAALMLAAAGLTIGTGTAASAYPAPPPAPTNWVFTTWLTGPDGEELDPFNLAAGQQIAIHTQGLPPGTVAVTSMFSDPVRLHAGVVSDSGGYDPVVTLPADADMGTHEIVVFAAAPDGTRSEQSTSIAITSVAVEAQDAAGTSGDSSGAGADDGAGSGGAAGSGSGSGGDGTITTVGEERGVTSPTVFTNELPPMGENRVPPQVLGIGVGLAILLALLVSIPAEVLQSTISENYGRLFGWMAPVNRRMQDVNHWLEAKRWHRWLGASASILVTAVVLSFSDPDFGLDLASLRLLGAMTISLAIVNLIPLGMAALEADRRWDADSLPMAMPGTILIAAVSVVVSRLGGLEPGLIFGIVVGISYSIHLTTRRAGQLVIVQFAGLAGVGLLAWLAYDLIGPAAPGDSGWHMLLREVLSATALDALVAPAIVMLPLTFLDGRSVWRWSKAIWVAIYALAAMLLAFIALPIARDVDEVPSGVSGWLIALGIFTAVAVVVWIGLRQKDSDRELIDA